MTLARGSVVARLARALRPRPLTDRAAERDAQLRLYPSTRRSVHAVASRPPVKENDRA